MRLGRFLRHAFMHPVKAARAFPRAALDAIQREIAAQEKAHRGEICFVIEAELTTSQLWRDVHPRQRARELFASRGVWNTEENNGVLIYVLLADRRVEIVADRGISGRVEASRWQAICREMEGFFAQGRFEEGGIAGVRGVALLLEKEYPGAGDRPNELPDRPAMI
ncbi:MAG TPA: TPM domain-containing protein [Usitatibacter sp.]|nr:TPM domain-containing protein [Usitatibacter sp.]